MVPSPKQPALVVNGRPLSVSQDETIVSGVGAEILQAQPRRGKAVEVGPFRDDETKSISVQDAADVIELALEDDLLLYTSIERLCDEIIPAADRGSADEELVLPNRITFTNQRTRGEDGLLIKSFKLLNLESKLAGAAGKKGGEFAAGLIARKIEDKLVGEGSEVLYKIITTGNGVVLKQAVTTDVDTSLPILLFIHGTASSTTGSFSELWDTAADSRDSVWNALQKMYQENIFALEHRTLTESPIDNVIRLMEELPAGCRLHLVSHSRGGLVGELLCRTQFNNSREPFTEDDISLFDTDGKSGFSGLLAQTKMDYDRHQQQLKKLNTLLIEKKPVVERFVRVACPARGTTLASGKLDVYLSGILNVIGLIPALKSSPVYSLLKAFVLAVAKERTKPEELPGLEAQMPGSPFIAMLNTVPESVSAHLAVIKGDIEPRGILKKISMFFLDRFYESDHDLVVNTPSMDGGARRAKPIPMLFDQGREINHFRYFENSRTRKGLLAGLTDATLPPKGFELETQKAAPIIARTVPEDKKREEVPAVFVLPGIVGSHLGISGDRIWVDFFDLVRGRFTKLDIEAKNVEALELVAKTYNNLIRFLGKTHYVIPFAYDWRRSLRETGRQLGSLVSEQLQRSDQPVRIVAHSMGGLVARAMMAERSEVWEQLCEREGSRVLMLGTPNLGSYSIPRIFARQDKLIRMLAVADLRHDQNELLDIIRKFPGVLELLPIKEKGRQKRNQSIIDIEDSVWDEFKEALPGDDWQRPDKADLDRAGATWEKLSGVALNPDKVFYIAGTAPKTPLSIEVIENGKGGKTIEFISTNRGDGQVLWDTGIPEGISHWFVDAVHGDIPDYSQAYAAYLEILRTGSTSQLTTREPVASGIEERSVMEPDSVDLYPDEDTLLAAGMGCDLQAAPSRETSMPKLEVAVVHGNLCFAKYPLAVGHYHGDTIVSAEAVLDRFLDHRLSVRQHKGVYPGPLMTNEVLFRNEGDQFPGALIVGLGEVGKLSSGGLTSTFRDAVIRYVLVGKETEQFGDKPIGLSTLLIGTGASEMTVKDSVVSLIRGIGQANRILAGPTNNYDLVVSKLDILELHEDIAISAQYALIDAAANTEFRESVKHGQTIVTGNGGRTRAFFSEEDEWWQRLRIETTDDGGLKYTTLAAQAKADMQIQGVQRQAIEPFLKELTSQTYGSNEAGRVLFEMLVPRELKRHAGEDRRMMLVVDKQAASYPWELMEFAGREGNEALAIKAGMIRQLATYHSSQTDVCTERSALVVGDPLSSFPELRGAQDEAKTVAGLLMDNRVEVKNTLIREPGSTILAKLMTIRHGILHLAGHGVVDFERPAPDWLDECEKQISRGDRLVTGMVLGDNMFLTTNEINQMPYTPAFVFINCCHLGSMSGDVKDHVEQRRYHLAANLATQFIEQGVKAVIAAGWAVNDAAALTFAATFYKSFFDSACFGEAVKEARAATLDKHPDVNTWGAYQCYGDPSFRISVLPKTHSTGGKKHFASKAEYLLAVKNIAQDATSAPYDGIAPLTDRLQEILDVIPDNYRNNEDFQAAVGDAWGELDKFEKAIDAYTCAIGGRKGNAPIRAGEQLANFKCREAVKKARAGDKAAAEELTQQALDLLDSLNTSCGKNVERLCLKGSVHKRWAQIDWINKVSPQKNLEKMLVYYEEAHGLSIDITGKINFYPLLNALAVRWLLFQIKVISDLADFDALMKKVEQATLIPELNSEYFWDAIAAADCKLLELLKGNRLSKKQAETLADEYERIADVLSSARQMRSVEEHVTFLWEMTTFIKDKKQAPHLKTLRSRLKAIR